MFRRYLIIAHYPLAVLLTAASCCEASPAQAPPKGTPAYTRAHALLSLAGATPQAPRPPRAPYDDCPCARSGRCVCDPAYCACRLCDKYPWMRPAGKAKAARKATCPCPSGGRCTCGAACPCGGAKASRPAPKAAPAPPRPRVYYPPPPAGAFPAFTPFALGGVGGGGFRSGSC